MKKYLIFIYLIISVLHIVSEDNTADNYQSYRKSTILDKDYSPKDKLKMKSLIIDAGGFISTRSRLLIGDNNKYFELLPDNKGFKPIPNDKWFAGVEANFWLRKTYFDHSFLHFSIIRMFKFQDDYIIPLF